MVELTKDELTFLKKVVEEKKKNFEREAKTILSDITLPFLESEERYEMFLESLLKKLK